MPAVNRSGFQAGASDKGHEIGVPQLDGLGQLDVTSLPWWNPYRGRSDSYIPDLACFVW